MTGGTPVTITGTGFTDVTRSQLRVGCLPARSRSCQPPRSRRPRQPNSAETVDVTVTTPGGTVGHQHRRSVHLLPGTDRHGRRPECRAARRRHLGDDHRDGLHRAWAQSSSDRPRQRRSPSTRPPQITATAPASAMSGTVSLRVTTPGGTSTTGNSADEFMYVSAPAVTGVKPSAAPWRAATPVHDHRDRASPASPRSTSDRPRQRRSRSSRTTRSPRRRRLVRGRSTSRSITAGGPSASSAADQVHLLPGAERHEPPARPPARWPADLGDDHRNRPRRRDRSQLRRRGNVGHDQVRYLNHRDGAGWIRNGRHTVTTPGGTSETSAADQFTYDPVPTVTSIGTTVGPMTGGTPVTITGTGFTGVSAVDFGSTAANVHSRLSQRDHDYLARDSAGTVDVTVTTPGGTSGRSAADQFTYYPAPTVTSINPPAGPLAGDTSVMITGGQASTARAQSTSARPRRHRSRSSRTPRSPRPPRPEALGRSTSPSRPRAEPPRRAPPTSSATTRFRRSVGSLPAPGGWREAHR